MAKIQISPPGHINELSGDAGAVAKASKRRSGNQYVSTKDQIGGSVLRTGRLVALVENLVLRYLPERLSEEFLSGSLGISIQELRSAFRMVRGTDLYPALRFLRMKEVKHRLDTNSGLSVESAMRQCGFGSYAYFRRAFLEAFGVDPKHYRQPRMGNTESPRRPTVSKAPVSRQM